MQHVFISMSDGVRLSADLYLPETTGPWPAILEALPYRKDDVTRHYEAEYRRLVTEGDYSVCRVDVRGTGSSEGLAEDEYTVREQADLCEIIAWLAARDSCTGDVGMYGTSYSGFNSFLAAMARPPALRAIIPIFASDARYTDDVHYGGGALRGIDLVDYPTYMVAMNALPPVPTVYGDGWREVWEERVKSLQPWVIRWLEEQNESPYWRQGSLMADYRAVEVPTMIVAGWADGYHNVAFRALERLNVQTNVLVGPWSHMSTESSIPGPHVDLVPEMIRWWDHWLRGVDNGVDADPALRVFVRRSTKGEPDLAEMRGEWRTERVWPPVRLAERSYPLGEGADEYAIRGDVGYTASIWCAGNMPWGPPFDQRPDEALSLVFDLDRVNEDVEILGHPRVEVVVESTVPVAYLSAKLCDVFPDGTSSLVSRGLLNLTHRDSHAEPTPLESGRPYAVTIELDATSWIFEPGHTIRLDLATSDFPSSWPPPLPGTVRIDRSRSRVVLPVLEGGPVAAPPALAPVGPAEEPTGRAAAESAGSTGPVTWRFERDILGREVRVAVEYGSDRLDAPQGELAMADRNWGTIAVSSLDPGLASCTGGARFAMRWPEVAVTTEARTYLRSDASAYVLQIELDVWEGDDIRWSRRWERRVPRQLQ